jgi:hypothetical protein
MSATSIRRRRRRRLSAAFAALAACGVLIAAVPAQARPEPPTLNAQVGGAHAATPPSHAAQVHAGNAHFVWFRQPEQQTAPSDSGWSTSTIVLVASATALGIALVAVAARTRPKRAVGASS